MSELTSLHPMDPVLVARYVAAVRGEMSPVDLLPSAPDWAQREIARAQRAHARAVESHEASANAISFGLARLLSATEPVFLLPDLGLTQLEARFDRGLGMMLRPPSRLFSEAGLEIAAARAMPIRLDTAGGSMGGAFLPPSRTVEFRDQLERRVERLARRMAEAEMDAPAYVGLLLEAASYASERGLGLYEAIDVVVPGEPSSGPPGVRLIMPDRKRLDRELRTRLETASRPPKEPGLLTRLFSRGRVSQAPPADVWGNGRAWRGSNDVTPPPEWQPEPEPGDEGRPG
jgi:hypothetical protein